MANRFWVGGTGAWDATTTRWSATSGGAGGASVPTAADDVFLDAASNATAYTVTISGSRTCRDITFAAPGTSGNVTFAHGGALTVAGSWTGYAGLIQSGTGNVTFSSTTTGKTVTTAGTAWTVTQVSFNGVGGGWSFIDTFTATASRLALTAGTLAFNGQTSAFQGFSSSGAGVRTLDLTNSTFNIATPFNNTAWTTATTTNLTVVSTGSTVTITSTANTTQALDFPAEVHFGGITLNNLTINCTSYAHLSLLGNVTVSGAYTPTGGNANTQRLHLYSDTPGTARTITCNGTISASNVDFEDIIIAGTAAPLTGTSIGNCGGNTSVTMTAAVTRYWVGNGGAMTDTARWSTSSGGASGASMPLPQDAAIFDANSFSSASQSITMAIELQRMGSMNFTGVTNTPTFNLTTGTMYHYGSLTFVAGMVTSVNNEHVLAGRGAFTFTQAALSGLVTYEVAAFGGTYTLLSALGETASRPILTLTRGTLDANDVDLLLRQFNSTNANVRTLSMGNGTWYLNITAVNQWNTPTVTNFTLNAEGSTIECQGSTSTTTTFSGGGKTYNNLRINKPLGGTGDFRVVGSNTFNDFKCISPAMHSILFTAATTTTVTSFSVHGIGGVLRTVGSITAANHNLVKSGGGTVNSFYLNLSRSQASGGTWNAWDSTDGGNNTGWVFNISTPPVINVTAG